MRFFFDLTDANGQHHDAVGLELPDVDAAQRFLETTLPRISAERSKDGGSELSLTMIVRDSFDRQVMQADLNWRIITTKIDDDPRGLRAGR